MLRALLLLLLIMIALLSVPGVRRRLTTAYGQRNWREFKRNLGLALLLYFLLSLVVTVYKYGFNG